MAIAHQHNLMVIEDACQAHLSDYQGKKLGTIAPLESFTTPRRVPVYFCANAEQLANRRENNNRPLSLCFIASPIEESMNSFCRT